MIQRIDARSVEQMNRNTVTIAEVAGGAVVPPEPYGMTNQPCVETADATKKQRIDQATTDKARTIDPLGTLTTPIIGHAIVMPQSLHIVAAKRSGITLIACGQKKEDDTRCCNSEDGEAKCTAPPGENNETAPNDRQETNAA